MVDTEFGVRLPVAGPLASTEAIRTTSREAERLGFDALWVHDFIPWTKHQDRTHVSCGSIECVSEDSPPLFFESLSTLAYVAGITERVKLGTAVLCLPFRQPVIAAKQVANIDALSNGRFVLGVGVGANKETGNRDFEVLGIPRKDKYERTAEYLKVMRELWTKDEPSYRGTYVNFEPTEMYPKPVQRPHPPIWFGGWGPKSRELIGEFGTGWLPAWITPEQYPEQIEALYEAARSKGRDNVQLTVGTEIYACIARTSEAAHAASRGTFAVLPYGFTKDATPETIAASALVGSPEEIQHKVQRYVDAGVSHFELKFVYQNLDHLLEQLELFSSEVLPSFRNGEVPSTVDRSLSAARTRG